MLFYIFRQSGAGYLLFLDEVSSTEHTDITAPSIVAVMRFTVVLSAALIAVLAHTVVAAPIDDAKSAVINEYDNDNIGINGYKFSFDTSDGTSRRETAVLKNAGTDHESISVEGSVSWVAADGQVYKLTYLADENGYQPEGEHLPKANN